MAAGIAAQAASIAPGQPVALFTANLLRASSRQPYDVARDGRFPETVALNAAATPPITLLMNCQAA